MKDRRMGVFSGMGMVIANMIGAGVFLSTGYMAQTLNPKEILLAWMVGAFLALAGTRAYARIARIVPESGGEYKYLSTLVHPALGYLAGWASLLIGFSAPIAIDAIAAGAYANTLAPWVDPKIFAAFIIIFLTGVHAVGLRFSVTTQNILVLIKIALVVGFIGIGLIGGHNAWPDWRPPDPSNGFPFGSFMQNLLFITFAFSGWNAAVYAASEFKNPGRDVSRAIILGCALVGILYLIVNWVFVANLTPEQCAIVTSNETGRITLGHLIMKNLIGETGAACMSVLVIIAFISAMSAMIFLGPRVYAEMAKDGFLPRVLQGRDGKAPVGAVILQSAIALFLVFAYQLGEVLSNVGAILTLFSALTVFGLFWVYVRRRKPFKLGPITVIAGVFYLFLSGFMLYFGFKQSGIWSIWVGVCILSALIGYFISRRRIAIEAVIKEECGFNFGAACCTILWLFFHGRIGTGICLLFFSLLAPAAVLFLGNIFLSIILLLIFFWIMIYFGMEGNLIVMKYKAFTSIAEVKKHQRVWNIFGMIVGIVSIISLVPFFFI